MTKETKTPTVDTDVNVTGFLARLRAFKKSNERDVTVTLPECGETVTYPGFVSHATIMKVFKKSGGQKGTAKMASVAIATLCRFGPEGEQISHTDVAELLPNRDVTFLSGKCLGVEDDDDDGDDDEGNALSG